MAADKPRNPWRPIFEDIRRVVGNQRDAQGVLGSINWLRKQMEKRGANPNVVRNIIYRDKGKLEDKRALFEILKSLWSAMEQGDLQVPELEVLLSAASSTEQEVMQLLGREKRRAYQSFVGSVRAQGSPKLLITGRPGSGKTLLTDYVQQALEAQPRAAERIVRLEFSSKDLALSLGRLARELGVPTDTFEAKLVRARPASPFAVQADAQAEAARVILDALRQTDERAVLLLHVSQSLALENQMSQTALRLNTPDVPRVSASEWLWVSLFEPMSRLERVSLLVTMADMPVRVAQQLGKFEEPLRLKPPTMSEARRFVKARLPALSADQQEQLVQRAGRSFEELRTLSLLADIRQTLPEARASETTPTTAHVDELSQLLTSAHDPRLRDFLLNLACLSLPTFPAFHEAALYSLRPLAWQSLNSLESAFLDALPSMPGYYRCFSRQLARALSEQLKQQDLEDYRQRHGQLALHYQSEALKRPGDDIAARYLQHLFEARNWAALATWLERHNAPQGLVLALWRVAGQELAGQETLEQIALQVAAHYVKLGSYSHPDAEEALALLGSSTDARLRAWTSLKRAESAMLKGHFDQSEALLKDWPRVQDPALKVEFALIQANLARWRAQLERAAQLIDQEAKAQLAKIEKSNADGRLIHAKVATWAGLIAKDQGQLEQALREFNAEEADDDILRARLAFQRGDVYMKLGQFGTALDDLNEAVERSRLSDAPPQEQARYLARRGSLARKQGRLSQSEQDFQHALGILDHKNSSLSASEKGFCQAKLRDEAALTLLAQGEFDRAIFYLKDNAETIEAYGRERAVDASYRLLRNALRLSLAYGCRGLNQPYGFPFICFTFDHQANADLRHARALAEETREQVARQQHRASYKALHRLSLLISSLLAASPEEATGHATAALEAAHYPYQEASSRAYLVHAALAERHDQQAREQISMGQEALKQSHQGAGDPGLEAWYALLQLRLYVLQVDTEAASAALTSFLKRDALRPFHNRVLRCYAEAVEATLEQGWLAHDDLRQLLALEARPLRLGNARLSDALVLRWMTLQSITATEGNK